ncbi:MAG: hypothetical protein IT288_05745 [Bdellovibrionales bacterium]|nr:hypothetical protein [Bdellovibrionales bacterium]
MKIKFGSPPTAGLLTALLASLLLVTACAESKQKSASPSAGNHFSNEAILASRVLVDERELNARYGIYHELEVILEEEPTQPAHWVVLQDQLPLGLTLKEVSRRRALIQGVAQFTGRWCFVLGAQVGTELRAKADLCVTAEDNDEITYPKFLTASELPIAWVDQDYEEQIDIDLSSFGVSYDVELYESQIPQGMYWRKRRTTAAIKLGGEPAVLGEHRLVFKVTDGEGRINSRQFQLQVLEEGELPEQPEPPSPPPVWPEPERPDPPSPPPVWPEPERPDPPSPPPVWPEPERPDPPSPPPVWPEPERPDPPSPPPVWPEPERPDPPSPPPVWPEPERPDPPSPPPVWPEPERPDPPSPPPVTPEPERPDPPSPPPGEPGPNPGRPPRR